MTRRDPAPHNEPEQLDMRYLPSDPTKIKEFVEGIIQKEGTPEQLSENDILSVFLEIQRLAQDAAGHTDEELKSSGKPYQRADATRPGTPYDTLHELYAKLQVETLGKRKAIARDAERATRGRQR